MRINSYIPLLLLATLTSLPGMGLAQSAQATMKVSVQVVKASGIDVDQPRIVGFDEAAENTLAELNFNGIAPQDLMINISQNLMLKNREGDKISLSVSDVFNDTDNPFMLELRGQPGDKIMKGVYSGILTATVEYL